MKIKMKPPMRLAIGELMLDGKPRTAKDVYDELAPLYSGEKQVNLTNLENHLQSLRAVGILAVTDSDNMQNTNADTLYVISVDGERRVKKYL